MPKARKRKTPITSTDTSDASSSKPQASRTLIRQFHVLLKQQAQLQQSLGLPSGAASSISRPSNTTVPASSSNQSSASVVGSSSSASISFKSKASGSAKPETTSQAARKLELAEVEHEIERLGGLAAYQRMSSIGQGMDRGGGSEKVFISWLRELGVHEHCKNACIRHRLLEVGALKPDNYASCSSWLEVTPMDLRSRHPAIMEQDFLKMNENEHRGKWDLISLSLVVNFVPQPKDRGQMLQLARSMLSEKGYLFLALPLPCVTNSRYLTFEHLNSLMTTIGFAELKSKWKEGGKMAYWLYGKDEPLPINGRFHKKQELRSGNRNNFCILL
ncbi:hypothetical protein HGRIS_013436 [Hohenbuehelia grisea]|uniref:25S rRNA adenine-N(1) methyltransferase n=1 Tax=Hohenbuehelia grisea TaxID=104357 RepID=A0ABR3IVH8_9AGAR